MKITGKVYEIGLYDEENEKVYTTGRYSKFSEAKELFERYAACDNPDGYKLVMSYCETVVEDDEVIKDTSDAVLCYWYR